MAGNDWRHDTLDRIRVLIEEADPDVSEEAKWAKASNPGRRSHVVARRHHLHR